MKARRSNSANGASATRHSARTVDTLETRTPREAGLPSDAFAPQTLTGSFVAGHTTSEDYVVATKPGYHSWYPYGARQPSLVLLWSAGQMVQRDHYDAHGGDDCAATPQDAQPTNEPGGGVPEHVSGIVAAAS